jgi:Uma2 family endonuclease
MAMAPSDISRLFPNQGHLAESDYLLFTDHTNRLAEFLNGQIEVLPMPTIEHQRIVWFLVSLLKAFIEPMGIGEALMAPVRIRLADGHFREPDVVFMFQPDAAQQDNRYWNGADLVMEVVSEDEPGRDLVVKRRLYAGAGIREYWIIHPRRQAVEVLRLENGEYVTHSAATASGEVQSALLEGFTADVAAVFAAGRNEKR